MRLWMRGLVALLGKELRLEARGKETVTLLFCNAALCAALIGVGTSSAFLDRANPAKVFPMLLWVLYVLSVSASAVRAYEQELEGRGCDGVLLAGATGPQMYVAKLFVSAGLCFAHFMVLAGLVSVALDQEVLPKLGRLMCIGLGASVALSALTVLLSAVAGTSRLRGVLLPIIAVPLVFPIFFAGIEMTSQLMIRGSLDPGTPWPAILVCTCALFVVLGINLYEAAVRD
jgi:heme exporter protein B